MPALYQIIVKGHIDHRWSDWFEGMTITHQSDGDTTLFGPVRDQAALHGVLEKVRDLNLTILYVAYVGETQP